MSAIPSMLDEELSLPLFRERAPDPMSGYSEHVLDEESQGLPIEFVEKPFSASGLAGRVRETLDR